MKVEEIERLSPDDAEFGMAEHLTPNQMIGRIREQAQEIERRGERWQEALNDRDAAIARAEDAEARYEELKSTHIEKVEAVRAEYLGQYLSLQAALAAAETATIERCAKRLDEFGDLSAAAVIRLIRAMKPTAPPDPAESGREG